jgi:positive regulator of sigma E activity
MVIAAQAFKLQAAVYLSGIVCVYLPFVLAIHYATSLEARPGRYPILLIVASRYSSTTLYQVSCHIQWLVF